MNFFLDENFPKLAHTLLSGQGHTVYDIRGTEAEGTDDDSLFKMAQDRASIVLTTDRDFFHTIPHNYSSHFGIIVIALRQPNERNIVDRLDWFLKRFSEASFKNRVFELRDSTYIMANESFSGD